MNRKQLRRAICGSAVILTLGGGLLSQASGEGGLISRLWDKRPRLSESRLNPRNWFEEGEASTPAVDLKPVVSVRPELTSNPFAAETGLPPGGATGAASGSAESTLAASSVPAATSGELTSGPSQAGRATAGTHDRPETAGGQAALPVIAPVKMHSQTTAQAGVPAPSIDSIFRRPSADMVERARRRKQGLSDKPADAPDVDALSERDALVHRASNPEATPATSGSGDEEAAPTRKSLLKIPRPVQPSSGPVESKAGRVAIGSLTAEGPEGATGKGFVRLGDFEAADPQLATGSIAKADTTDARAMNEAQAAAEAAVEQPASAYERLLAQITGQSGDAAAAGVSHLAAQAPRLPDDFRVNPEVDSDTEVLFDAAGQAEQAQAAVSDAAVDRSGEAAADLAARVPSDAGTRAVDEMIAQSRAEMGSTFLARQATLERQVAAASARIEGRVDQVSVSQANASGPESAPPLMVPQGFSPRSFRTYGEAPAVVDQPAGPVSAAFGQAPQTFGPSGPAPSSPSSPSSVHAGPLTGLSRIEQAVRSAEQRSSGPAIVPGPVGSGVVIDGQQYSVVKPRVTSNAAPSLSVPDNSTFRRLSYERRADELAGQVERLADSASSEPILITPGEPLPQVNAAAATFRDAASAGGEGTVVSSSSPIDWPEEADLAPEKPKSGGTSWGFVIFCLALLAAGTHIAVSRFRQSRMAAAAVKS